MSSPLRPQTCMRYGCPADATHVMSYKEVRTKDGPRPSFGGFFCKHHAAQCTGSNHVVQTLKAWRAAS